MSLVFVRRMKYITTRKEKRHSRKAARLAPAQLVWASTVGLS